MGEVWGDMSVTSPKPAAALIVVRPALSAPEILLLKRSASARFMPNAYVFPGGAVDPEDATEEVFGLCAGVTDAAASVRLNLPSGGLGYVVAAVRETFEECGLLLVRDSGGGPPGEVEGLAASVRSTGPQARTAHTPLAPLLRLHQWRIAADELSYFAHWITPIGLRRRFDTRFFLACAPERQVASLMSDEMSDLIWTSAADALRMYAAGRLQLMFPTRTLLAEIARFERLDALLEYARQPRDIATVMPEFPSIDAPG